MLQTFRPTEPAPSVPPKPTNPQPGFGRITMPNPGSRRFALRSSQPRRAPSSWKTKTWRMGRLPGGGHHTFQNQGMTSTCVRHGWMHVLMLEPLVRFDARSLTDGLYLWAQQHDAWPGEEPTYYGTSVDAGAQFCLHYNEIHPEVTKPLISRYDWANSMDDVCTRLTLPASQGGGPLVLGADFSEGMSGSQGQLFERNVWIPNNDIWGGHCFVADGYIAKTAKRPAYITLGNSHEGNYKGIMEADAFEWLIFGQYGEACAVTETPR